MDFKDILLQFLRRRHFRGVMPKAALLDMDGTLYDSMGNHADAWMSLSAEAGFDATRDEFFLYEGCTGAYIIDLLMRRSFGRPATEAEKHELYQRKTRFFNEMPAVGPMPGAREMVDIFVRSGITPVVVTGSGQASLIDRLSRDFDGAFRADLMVTAHNVTHGKPHPEPFIKGMQLARVSPSAAIAVDNAPLGVKSAADAGVFTAGVVTGPVPREALEESGATAVFSSMTEFADLLPELLYTMVSTSVDAKPVYIN